MCASSRVGSSTTALRSASMPAPYSPRSSWRRPSSSSRERNNCPDPRGGPQPTPRKGLSATAPRRRGSAPPCRPLSHGSASPSPPPPRRPPRPPTVLPLGTAGAARPAKPGSRRRPWASSGPRARRAAWRAWLRLLAAACLPWSGQRRSMARSRWRWCQGARASSFRRLAAFLSRHAPSSTVWVPTETRNPPSSQRRSVSGRPTRASGGPSSTLPARCGGISRSWASIALLLVSLASLQLVAQVGPRQGFGALSVNQVGGNKNPSNPEIRWFLGTAIKSRLRAAPILLPVSKRTQPRKSDTGVAREEGEANEAHDCFAHGDGDDATGGSIGGDGPIEECLRLRLYNRVGRH